MDKNLATEILRGFVENLDNTKVKEAIFELHPELAESKDEKIRKKMVKHFKSKIKKTWCNIPVEDIISYLEKQKEPRDYRKLYEEVIKSDWFKENYVGKSLGEDQKLAEWSDEDIQHRNKILLDLQTMQFQYSVDKRKNLKDANFYDVCMKDNGENMEWLKHLPERLNLQPKQEWSEEDKKTISFVIDILRENHPDGFFKTSPAGAIVVTGITTEDLVKKLKSLLSHPKPSGNWKPSEDQMDALRYVKQFDYGGVREFLESLYEDLKEL